jgi:hypothetical protein
MTEPRAGGWKHGPSNRGGGRSVPLSITAQAVSPAAATVPPRENGRILAMTAWCVGSVRSTAGTDGCRGSPSARRPRTRATVSPSRLRRREPT